MSGRFFVTDGAVEGWLSGQHVIAPKGSEAWKLGERELIDLINLAAERKQPKSDNGQLYYKVGRELIREVVTPDHPFASMKDGAVPGRLEIYLHMHGVQLVAVRMRSRASRPQGSGR